MSGKGHERENIVRIKLKPRASRSRIEDIRDGVVEVAVTSPPVGGAANDEMIKLLADAIGVSKSSISLKSGFKSRNKTVCVEGVSRDLLERKLHAAVEPKKRDAW